MNPSHLGPSEFWRSNLRTHIRKDLIKDLENFKSSDINFKVALWNPKTNGVRYLKTLLYNLCATVSNENWQQIKRIENRDLGNPIAVTYNNVRICLDYLQAALELEFINENLDPTGSNVLEIGAGYGRTCHAIMSNHDVNSYYIIDLENCLHLSQNYLQRVLKPEPFSKIHFVSNEAFHLIGDMHFDLGINIDSFSEMDAAVVESYKDYLCTNCNHFYVKNPTGKYMDKSLDDHFQGEDIVRLAMRTGLLTDIIDIHNNQEIKNQVPKFIDAYRPGENWQCIADAWSPPWSFYWQALYQRTGEAPMT